ncbi:hypothetical protein J7E24_05445 [Hymenobacter sp. ISL-91]|uniref:hypothetical protein n=1 Tax=Hymenobacter sp. ISL-91 TaxID=2819151 RepID=UPI001BE5DB3E|nr:hypothetical protein [Hymenobacter sp. ISL-91]MBT2557219.1 hypothetical protein [Hymenobacter sp. ISL-91]
MQLTKEEQREAAYYYSCLYNSLVLFAASPAYLYSLAGPVFDPEFERASDFDYAFRYPAFDSVFATGKVSETLRGDLLAFKHEVDAIPDVLWTWDEIVSNPLWKSIAVEADALLTKMGDSRRTYDFGFTIHIPA